MATRYWVHDVICKENYPEKGYKTAKSAIAYAKKMNDIARRISPDYKGTLFEVWEQCRDYNPRLIMKL